MKKLEIQFNHIQPNAFETVYSSKSLWGNNLVFDSGHIYQILASSGSGKSTLVSILAGLRGDYNGSIVISGKSIDNFTPLDWSRWRSYEASFVYQDLRLFGNLTANQNINIYKQIQKKISKSYNDKIDQFATELKIESKLNTLVKYLSFGQMQRVAILRALNRDYKWLILDEPFSHLDIENAKIAWNLLKTDAEIKKAGLIITSLDPYDFIHPKMTFIL